MSAFVYHFKPPNFHGSTLLPLNSLLKVNEEVAKPHLRKYESRPKLVQQIVGPLGCLWNDVIHLSPINPQMILDEWRKKGIFRFHHP